MLFALSSKSSHVSYAQHTRMEYQLWYASLPGSKQPAQRDDDPEVARKRRGTRHIEGVVINLAQHYDLDVVKINLHNGEGKARGEGDHRKED